jgi:L-ribulose-5-phosphate 3-epimerase UlaE
LGASDDSPELRSKKAYMAAVKEFALTLQKYNTYYDQADEATQAKWKENIDPAFKQVDLALAAWKLAMDNNFDPAANEQAYLQLKADLLVLLLNVFN